jgi:hypothetical protein
MVNADTGMLEYLYLPETDTFVREQSPIRDIASVWDAALVGAFLKRDDLRVMIERSVRSISSITLATGLHSDTPSPTGNIATVNSISSALCLCVSACSDRPVGERRARVERRHSAF